MHPLRARFWLPGLLLGLIGIASAQAQQSPLLIRTAVTTTLDPGGRPWAYVILNENYPGLLAGRSLAVYQKNALPDAAGTFTFRGLIAPATDSTACGVMLSRAQSIGDNTVALDTQLTALHLLEINKITSVNPPSVNPPTLALNRRLSALLARAAGDSNLTQMLDLLGLAHPAVRLARGTAWAGPLQVAVGSDVTLEIRERDVTGADSAVMARVSLKAGQPTLLPAPGPIAIVPDKSASADLTIKFRWATPDALRSAGILHSGDVAWRVSKSFAEANGFQVTPPAGATLDALALSNPTDVKRVAAPVFPSKLFSATDVADFVNDPATVFVTDNNDRYTAGGMAMPEGAQVYYFVAGADALGRPGLVSPGTQATFCVRVPPHVPTRLAVKNLGSPGVPQKLDVNWYTTLPGDGTSTTRYEVYRGNDLALHSAAQQGLLNLDASPIVAGNPDGIKRIAMIADPGANPAVLLHVLDDGLPTPNTWWYAVRAVHVGPLGSASLVSALGPPVFGSLRDRSAPVASAAAPPPMVPECLRVACVSDRAPAVTVSPDPLDPSVLQFTMQCARRNRGIASVHVQVMAGASTIVPETILLFPEIEETATPDQDTVEYSWTLPLASQSQSVTVQCRAEAIGGVLSAWTSASSGGVSPAGNQYVLFHFLAGAISETERQVFAGDPLWSTLGAPGPGDCNSDVHLAFSPETGQIFSPQVCLPVTASAAQYRIYRRIDDGPLTLMASDNPPLSAGTVCVNDLAPPTSNGRVYYFGQMLDKNGHAGAMVRLGSLRFTGYKPPTPILLSPKPADFGGTLASPTVTIRWSCPPEHVDRFEVYFSTSNPSTGMGSVPGSGITVANNVLRYNPTAYPTVQKVVSKVSQFSKLLIRVDESFITGPVNGVLGPGPLFSVTMNVDPKLRYKVWLRALGSGGEQGDASRNIEFSWQAPAGPLPSIAWPARPLPPVASFNPGIGVFDLIGVSSNWNNQSPAFDPYITPVAIRVGSLASKDGASFNFNVLHDFGNGGEILAATSSSDLSGRTDPNTQIFTNATDPKQRLAPFVLYRQQVPSTAFPSVSGDVIQVSPLVSKIAWRPFNNFNGRVGAEMVDPFFVWGREDTPDNNTHITDLYLLDTQPVISGASYRYWLTRFSDLGEPIQTVPCGTVTIQ